MLFFLVELFFIEEVDFLVEVTVPVPFFALICELLEVVLMVSLFLVAQEERKAMPIKATVKERMFFFIGRLLTTLPDRQARPSGQAKSTDLLSPQCHDRVDPGGAPGRDEDRGRGDEGE